jgi:hypothetical protein
MIGRSISLDAVARELELLGEALREREQQARADVVPAPVRISRVPAMPPTYAFFSRQRTRKPRFARSAVAASRCGPRPPR